MATEHTETEHLSVDFYPVTAGAKFWDNNLRVVQVTAVAEHANAYRKTGEVQTWHQTTDGQADTLSGSMRPYGRLVRFYGGMDAEEHVPGTRFSDLSHSR